MTKEGVELKKYLNEEQLTKMKERMKEVPMIEYGEKNCNISYRTTDFGQVGRITGH